MTLSLSFLSPPTPTFPLPSPLLPSPPSSPLFLEVGPLNSTRGLEKCCKHFWHTLHLRNASGCKNFNDFFLTINWPNFVHCRVNSKGQSGPKFSTARMSWVLGCFLCSLYTMMYCFVLYGTVHCMPHHGVTAKEMTESTDTEVHEDTLRVWDWIVTGQKWRTQASRQTLNPDLITFISPCHRQCKRL